MFLNYHATASTEIISQIGAVWANFMPELYENVDSGLNYPVLALARSVSIKQLPRVGPTAFILAGGNANFAGLPNKAIGPLDYDYKVKPNTLTQIFAHKLSMTYPQVERISVDHSACASSLHVLWEAKQLLANGYSRVIVTSLEDQINQSSFDFFSQAGVQSTPTPSAFDSKQLGFNLGHGAVTAVFENVRTSSSVAEVLAVNSASEDTRNPLGMDQGGEGYIRAIRGLERVSTYSGRLLDTVSVVKTHGTGTDINNRVERMVLEQLLTSEYIATSFKPLIGHTLGASGLLESVLLLARITHGMPIPAIAHRSETDNVFLSYPRMALPGNVLALAAGMGSIFSAVIWRPLK